MRRTVSTPRVVLVLAVALVAGVVTGVAGHALTQSAPPLAHGLVVGSSSGSSTGPPKGRSTRSTQSGLLGAGNVLATSDFIAVGWHDVVVDVLANGEAQYLYSCERRQLTETGLPTATIDVSWNRRQSLSAAETVAELTSPPQTRTLFARLTSWYDECTLGRPGSGRVTPSTRLGTVRTSHGTALIWRVGGTGRRPATYAILARDDYRLGLIDLYSDLTPPNPAGLRRLAQSALDRLS